MHESTVVRTRLSSAGPVAPVLSIADRRRTDARAGDGLDSSGRIRFHCLPTAGGLCQGGVVGNRVAGPRTLAPHTGAGLRRRVPTDVPCEDRSGLETGTRDAAYSKRSIPSGPRPARPRQDLKQGTDPPLALALCRMVFAIWGRRVPGRRRLHRSRTAVCKSRGSRE
ncbi:hypothetical protein OH77DRAFT_145233 [Trametes cingulata]|nr:hypothetical protein OH77DRAFT_145233 [Trametes cingulata]